MKTDSSAIQLCESIRPADRLPGGMHSSQAAWTSLQNVLLASKGQATCAAVARAAGVSGECVHCCTPSGAKATESATCSKYTDRLIFLCNFYRQHITHCLISPQTLAGTRLRTGPVAFHTLWTRHVHDGTQTLVQHLIAVTDSRSGQQIRHRLHANGWVQGT